MRIRIDEGSGPVSSLGDRQGGPGGVYDEDVGTEPEAVQAHRDCTIMHVDMDAFYVSVELLRRPDLVGVPVIVGGLGGRSVVLSASYEARRYGVRSAMPMATARRLCPQAQVLEPHQDVYRRVSARLMEIFESITPLVEPLSVDEAFLDIAGSMRRLGPPRTIGELIRTRVRTELGITASVGIASTKFVAKIASTRSKPDGLLLVPKDGTISFLHALDVSALWGVGAKTREALARVGISTVADVANTPPAVLQRLLGATGLHVHELSWGRDPRAVTPVRVEKSIGAEETFATDVDDDEALETELLRLAHRTAARMRSAGLQCRSVSLKLRYADFSTLTRTRTLAEPVDSAQLLYEAVRGLLAGLGRRPMSVRLVGLRAEHLESAEGAAQQLTLDGRDDNWRSAEDALDRINRRFGNGGIMPARLLRPENQETRRTGDKHA
ncbi:DNA polymerase IV [Arthrobacter caoxuetaonis]|uniref:DNA polymerase IV n=1 Tax=Arthrobacter caoxuetaonis TaxID=2886935 RepID=A0A9X1MH42_9MICC|nr:DNA polymerase IV [Arthrobacter caoxuetaonis]MCC3299165.1 DNA polymerase IV [Arthrobacter caoxuetaonis]